MSSEFEKLSLEERRVLVAKDVLAMLEKALPMEPMSGAGYLRWKKSDDRPTMMAAAELQNMLLTKLPPCSVCALGAALISMVRLWDGIDGREFVVREHYIVRERLGVKFARMLEHAFEGWGFLVNENDDGNRILYAAQGLPGDRRERLEKLMKKVVRLKGDEDKFFANVFRRDS